MENGKQCAFSCITAKDVGGIEYSGLNKREYFAGLAMQGLIVSQGQKHMVNDWRVHGQRISENAVYIADELLKQLEK